jgi:hypothetical protein
MDPSKDSSRFVITISKGCSNAIILGVVSSNSYLIQFSNYWIWIIFSFPLLETFTIFINEMSEVGVYPLLLRPARVNNRGSSQFDTIWQSMSC